MNVVEKIVKDLESATYKWGDKKYESFAVSPQGIPVVTEILYRNLEEEAKRTAELEAKCFTYEAIISNSNFKAVLNNQNTDNTENIPTTPNNTFTEEMLSAIYGALMEEAHLEHIIDKKFKLGEEILYNPKEVTDILRRRFIGGQQ